MKYFFIINPAAGQGEARALITEIDAVCSVAGIEYEIYETTSVGDGERHVRSCCEAYHTNNKEELSPDCIADAVLTGHAAVSLPDAGDGDDTLCAPVLRFYACGGDGTLNEVVNGAAGFDFAEVGCIPAGTGNDFIRNFPEARFDDLARQIRGAASLCDLIHYEGECDGKPVSRYCVNMFNIGFDSNVVDMTAQMKQKPLMSGSLAYLASVAAMLIRKKGADLRVEYPDGYVYDGKLLLIAVANGCYCGGGVKGLPRSVTDDGMFDVSLIRDLPRHTFVQLFPKYMKGTHLSDPRLDGVIRYTNETTLHISPNHGTMKLCVDGEITNAGAIRFEICRKAFRFIIP